MKRLTTFSWLILGAMAPVASGQSLVNAGILGNSGAEGDSLVTFAPRPAPGLGVVYDKFGFLWDRGGDGVLNRYAVDGRLVAQYPLPATKARYDLLTQVGESLVLLINGKIYTLPINAAPGTAPKATTATAEMISFGSKDGKIATYAAGQFSILDVASGATQPAGSTQQRVTNMDLAPDGSILASIENKTARFFGGVESTDGWPRNSLMSRYQFLPPYWYGQTGHGTIRRYKEDLEPAPGVVLGGASGSFIGHLDGNHELNTGRGMAALGNGIFAVSGQEGVMHLLQWNEEKTEFHIVRRLGALASCDGISVSPAGEIRTEIGYWKWSDAPDTPIRESGGVSLVASPTVDARGMTGLTRQGTENLRLFSGTNTDNKSAIINGSSKLAKSIVGTATIRNKGVSVILLAANGQAESISAGAKGQGNAPEPVTITTATPVKKWSALVNGPTDTLIAAGDGAVIELAKDATGWKETKRWNQWAGDQFGALLSLYADGSNLWVSDSARHRVLLFDLKTGTVLASFGTKDKAGSDDASLNLPTTIAANGKRAAVYDSGNQRVIKLEWK